MLKSTPIRGVNYMFNNNDLLYKIDPLKKDTELSTIMYTVIYWYIHDIGLVYNTCSYVCQIQMDTLSKPAPGELVQKK